MFKNLVVKVTAHRDYMYLKKDARPMWTRIMDLVEMGIYAFVAVLFITAIIGLIYIFA